MVRMVTDTARIRILRIPEHTDGDAEGIGPRRNLFRRSGRTTLMWDVSDEALLAGLAMGDRAAALVFVRRFQRRVYGCALAIVRDAARAEEVAQEAFLRAWRHAAMYDERKASVPTWLLTITRNLAIDAVRVERVRPADRIDL